MQKARPLALVVSLALLAFAQIPLDAQAQATCAGNQVCKGNAYAEATVALDRTVHASLDTTINGAVAHGVDQATWEMDAAACITFEYTRELHGAPAPDPPNLVIIQVRNDNVATVIREFNNGAEPANGQTYSFCGTSTGVAGAAARAGTVRLYLRIVKNNSPGGVGNYDVNSDTAAVRSQGLVRTRAFATALARNTPTCCGTTYAFGAPSSESMVLWVNMTQRYADNGVLIETLRIGLIDAVNALIIGGSSFEQGTGGAGGNSSTSTESSLFAVDLTLPAASASYGVQGEIMGLSVLGAIPWTTWASAGHGAGVVRFNDTVVRKSDVLTADPRIRWDRDAVGTFATADNDTTCTQTVYNRGEAIACTGYLLNARSEFLTRSMTIASRASDSTVENSVSDTGPVYSSNYTAQATHKATADTTGDIHLIRATSTDQSQDAPVAFGLSSLYFIDAHPQLNSTLDPDDFPTQDAMEDHEYIISADLLFGWCHVKNVRLDTNIDTSGNAVTLTMFNPFGDIADTASRDTAADGWTTPTFGFTPEPPAGMWAMRCAVSFQGNSAQDDEGIDFISSFTANLLPRFWTNTTLRPGQEYKIVIRPSVDDEPAIPDVVPRVNITRVNTTGAMPVFTVAVDNAAAPNVLDWMPTINGTTYQLNWTPPAEGVYNIRVRVSLQSTAIRGHQSIEVLNATLGETVQPFFHQLPELNEETSFSFLLFLFLMVWSMRRQYFWASGMALLGVVGSFVTIPYTFTACALGFVLAISLEYILSGFRMEENQPKDGQVRL